MIGVPEAFARSTVEREGARGGEWLAGLPGIVGEPDAFAVWGGRGAVLLHERDDAQYAMLLERAQGSTLAEEEDGDEVVTVAGRISRRLAVPAPPGLPRRQLSTARWTVTRSPSSRPSAFRTQALTGTM